MIIRLFCPKCTYIALQEKKRSGSSQTTIDVPMPISHLADDGKYIVNCDAGHTSYVLLDNLKFELLFEMGLHALLNKNPRDAISYFSVSLERYYEYVWRCIMTHFRISESEQITAWKHASKLSERQLGMFITAYLMLTNEVPPLLNPNKEVKLRNNVIHNGYIPTKKRLSLLDMK